MFKGEVKDYFIDGKLQMSGWYDNNGNKQGKFTFYYHDGTASIEGEYLDNLKFGEWQYYHPNKKLHQKVVYSESDFIVKEFYDSAGKALVINGNGKWSNSYKHPATEEILSFEGTFIDGKKDGTWICYSEGGLFRS